LLVILLCGFLIEDFAFQQQHVIPLLGQRLEYQKSVAVGWAAVSSWVGRDGTEISGPVSNVSADRNIGVDGEGEQKMPLSGYQIISTTETVSFSPVMAESIPAAPGSVSDIDDAALIPSTQISETVDARASESAAPTKGDTQQSDVTPDPRPQELKLNNFLNSQSLSTVKIEGKDVLTPAPSMTPTEAVGDLHRKINDNQPVRLNIKRTSYPVAAEAAFARARKPISTRTQHEPLPRLEPFGVPVGVAAGTTADGKSPNAEISAARDAIASANIGMEQKLQQRKNTINLRLEELRKQRVPAK
jgi:hypothetical protein